MMRLLGETLSIAGRLSVLSVALLLSSCDITIDLGSRGSVPEIQTSFPKIPSTAPELTRPSITPTLPLTLTPTSTTTELPSQTPTPTPTLRQPTVSPALTRTLANDRVKLGWIHFTAVDIGWAIEHVGSNIRKQGRDPRILRTEDAGVSWMDITPDTIPAKSRSILYPFDSQSAILVSSIDIRGEQNNKFRSHVTFFRTSDGGKNWAEIDSYPITGLGPSQLDFIDTLHGWMMVWGGVAAGSEGFELYRTTDGGKNWSQVMRSPRDDSGYQEEGDIPSYCAKTGIGFVDDHSGWVSGACGVTGELFLYATNDSGENWFPRRTMPLPPGAPANFYKQYPGWVYPPVFVQDRKGYMVITFSQAVSPRAVLYTTDDGGAIWTPTILPSFHSLGIDFVNPRTGWISDREQLFMTLDGGRTWNKLEQPPRLRRYENTMDFVDELHGWISDEEMLYRTLDGGVSWGMITPRLTTP